MKYFINNTCCWSELKNKQRITIRRKHRRQKQPQFFYKQRNKRHSEAQREKTRIKTKKDKNRPKQKIKQITLTTGWIWPVFRWWVCVWCSDCRLFKSYGSLYDVKFKSSIARCCSAKWTIWIPDRQKWPLYGSYLHFGCL